MMAIFKTPDRIFFSHFLQFCSPTAYSTLYGNELIMFDAMISTDKFKTIIKFVGNFLIDLSEYFLHNKGSGNVVFVAFCSYCLLASAIFLCFVYSSLRILRCVKFEIS